MLLMFLTVGVIADVSKDAVMKLRWLKIEGRNRCFDQNAAWVNGGSISLELNSNYIYIYIYIYIYRESYMPVKC